jgi:hypothetical protein
VEGLNYRKQNTPTSTFEPAKENAVDGVERLRKTHFMPLEALLAISSKVPVADTSSYVKIARMRILPRASREQRVHKS